MRHQTCRAALLLIALLSPAFARPADACSCMPIPPCLVAWRADAVFVATAGDTVEEHLGGHLYWTVQKLGVTRILRGTPGPSVTMVPQNQPDPEAIAASLAHEKVWAGANSCAYDFRRGEEYLVYATRAANGRWTTSLCSGTKPLAAAQADLEYFAGLSTAEPTGRVYGSIERTIVDPADPAKTRTVPANDVDVALSTGSSETRTTTNAEGKFEVRLRPGDYRVRPVVPDGVRYYGGSTSVTLAARGCAPANFSLISDGRIEGRVVRADGSTVPHVSVGVVPSSLPAGKRPDNSTTSPAAMTDEEGRFAIDAILPGSYLLAVNPRFGPDLRSPYAATYFPGGGRSDAVQIEMGDGERKTGYMITVTPLPETKVIGQVVFDDQPVAGARLVVYPVESPGHLVSSATTDSAGAFRLRVLAGVTYVIRAEMRTADGYRQTETRLFVAEQVDGLRISIR